MASRFGDIRPAAFAPQHLPPTSHERPADEHFPFLSGQGSILNRVRRKFVQEQPHGKGQFGRKNNRGPLCGYPPFSEVFYIKIYFSNVSVSRKLPIRLRIDTRPGPDCLPSGRSYPGSPSIHRGGFVGSASHPTLGPHQQPALWEF
jgi:hypothetical protein